MQVNASDLLRRLEADYPSEYRLTAQALIIEAQAVRIAELEAAAEEVKRDDDLPAG